MKPLLSIVVPTKDRYKYLKHLIELINSIQSDQIELVLQDNTADNKEILDFFSQKEYSFIKYNHNTQPLPVCYNSDLAVLNSSGKYVCMIGDDDGITRHIVDCVKWMEEYEIEAVVPSSISYHWPDYISSITGNISGTLMYKPFSQTYKYIDSLCALNELKDKGFIYLGELPLLYHGIVRRDILDKIFRKGGTYFPGPSPDIANAVALSLIVNKYVRLDFPIVISGASKTHGGGIRKLKNKLAEIESVPFLPSNTSEYWEKNIPRIWTGETIWPESAIKALRYMGRDDIVEKVNFEFMLAKFISFHFTYKKLATQLSKDKIRLWVYILKISSSRYFKALKRMISHKFFQTNDGMMMVNKIQDIKEVADYLSKIKSEFSIYESK